MILSLCSPRAFRRIGVTTIAAVFFLILVGGIVRASGAGMGCPDWPKCFDRWVPPTDESQLPPDYQEIYKDRGYADTTFNAVKTWTEYINRLVGVTIGFLIFLTLLSSLGFLRNDPAVTGLSLASFLLVGFQGWLGSLVVASNLVPYLITLHMVLALVLVALLILVVARSQRDALTFTAAAPRPALGVLLWLALALSLVQVILGTQVREHVDMLSKALATTDRSVWVEHMGGGFYVHRTLSLLVLALNAYLARTVLKQGGMSAMLNRSALALLFIITVEIVSGAALYYFAIPPVLQPVHLLLASLMFGLQFFMIIAYHYGRRAMKLSNNARTSRVMYVEIT